MSNYRTLCKYSEFCAESCYDDNDKPDKKPKWGCVNHLEGCREIGDGKSYNINTYNSREECNRMSNCLPATKPGGWKCGSKLSGKCVRDAKAIPNGKTFFETEQDCKNVCRPATKPKYM